MDCASTIPKSRDHGQPQSTTFSTALEAIRRGAYDYILKPFEKDQLFLGVGRALQHRRLVIENRSYKATLSNSWKNAPRSLPRAWRSSTVLRRHLEALGSALDLKDAETEGHCNASPRSVFPLQKRCLCPPIPPGSGSRRLSHDIGKMAIPDSILRKPGPLDDAEKKEMREHCQIGYDMLTRIPFLRDAAEIVLAHQEFFDGSGYPAGLKGEQIPSEARIFTSPTPSTP